MIVRETRDLTEIKRILCHPEIYDCISDDYSPNAEEFEPPLFNVKYIGGYVENEIIGVMIYHNKKGQMFCHIQVLPEFRKEYAEEFAGKALNEQLKDNDVVWAEVPDCYQNVLRFAKSFGFQIVDVYDDGYLKNGELSYMNVLRYTHGICKNYNRQDVREGSGKRG